MKRIVLMALLLTITLSVSAFCLDSETSKADISYTECLVYTDLNYHSIVTWVNDEPVLVCDNVYNSYNRAFWLYLNKGMNTVHFTAQRLPENLTAGIAEWYPDRAEKDVSVVKFIQGSMFEYTVLKTWKARDILETSPTWTIFSEKGYRPSLENYELIEKIEEQDRQEIKNFLDILKEALKKKDLSIVGANESTFNDFMREIGFRSDNYLEEVFKTDFYTTSVVALDDLEIIHGKKTIMVYRQNEEPICSAGRSPEAPQEDGKWYHSLSFSSLFFVKKEGRLRFLWPEVSH